MSAGLDSARNRFLPAFAWFAVFYNIAVVVWGALVRATGSGAGCGNHWPLCNGQIIPSLQSIHTIIEFTHRLMSGGVDGFVVLALVVWVFRATRQGDAARGFATATAVLVLTEAILGALLVKLGYVTDNQSTGRMVVLSVHLSNTLLLLAALTLTARSISLTRSGAVQSWSGLHRARGFGWAIAGLAATILVGVSGSMAALADTLFPSGSLAAGFAQDFSATAPSVLRLRILHPMSALVAGLFVVWLLARSRTSVKSPSMQGASHLPRLALGVAGLLLLQFALGIADVLLLAPAWMQLLHLLGADLYWVALVTLAAETIWPAEAIHSPATSDSIPQATPTYS